MTKDITMTRRFTITATMATTTVMVTTEGDTVTMMGTDTGAITEQRMSFNPKFNN